MALWNRKPASSSAVSPAAVRSVEQLCDVREPAWPDLSQAIAQADVPVVVLPAEPSRATGALHRLQMTTASTLGALVLHSGGLLVDHGWLRLLGGGSGDLPDLASANNLPEPSGGGSPPYLVVAYDALGGVFALDGGGLGLAPGEVCYRGPDTLSWDTIGAGHSAFVHGALTGALDGFFGPLRWPGWQAEVGALSPDQGLSLYPPPFTKEGRNISAVSRRAVPLAEVLGFYDDAAAQLAGIPDGQSVRTAE